MLVEAYGECALSYSQVSRWLKAFKEGREGVVDEPRAGRPSTSSTDVNLDRVRDLLNSDRRLRVRLIADTLNIPKTIVHELVTEKTSSRPNRKRRLLRGSHPEKGLASEKGHRRYTGTPSQRAEPHRTASPRIQSEAQLGNAAPTPLLTRHCTGGLFPVPKNQDQPQGDPLRDD
ncbi:hypothetical protein AAG570_008623 [Ranatra chinensis]|uniref:Transposase n=1 Tax=Ranatra chinensis TaxID=642074 RepID=A0ABD0YRF5_9HEMI